MSQKQHPNTTLSNKGYKHLNRAKKREAGRGAGAGEEVWVTHSAVVCICVSELAMTSRTDRYKR